MALDFAETYKNIGSNIRKYRLKQGLTQQDLADKIPKMDRSKISDMENGKEDFVFSKLLQICKALGVSLEDIIK